MGKLFTASAVFPLCMDPAMTALHTFPMAKKGTAPPAAKRPTWRRLPLAEWLDFVGQSQTWLAEQTGKSDPQISHLINGKRPYNQKFLEDAAKAFEAAAGIPVEPSMLFYPPRFANPAREQPPPPGPRKGGRQ